MTERRGDRSEIRPDAVRKQLEHVAREGEFELLVLADGEGFDVGWTGDDETYGPEEVQAYGSLLTSMKSLIARYHDLSEVAEADILRVDGRRIVCRWFRWRSSDLGLLGITRTAELHSDLIDRVVSGVQRILTQG